MTAIKTIFQWAFGLLFWVVVGSFVYHLVSGTDGAACKNVSTHAVEQIYADQNGNPDYGIKVRGQVQNSGEAGDLSLTARLTTSEGEYSRTRTVFFAKSQVLEVDFDFTEPTINATNVQYAVTCRP